MNILGTCTSYPPAVGGAQILFHETFRPLVKGDLIQVLTFWTSHRTDWLRGTTIQAPRVAADYELDGVRVSPIHLSASARLKLALPAALYYPTWGGTGVWMAKILEPILEAMVKVPDIVHNMRVGREHLSWASLRIARRRDVPFVMTPVHHPRWNTSLYRSYHSLFRSADAIICLSPGERDQMVKLGVSEDRIHLTGMGPVLADAYDGAAVRAQLGLGAHPFVLFLGQKFRYKGIQTLVEAAPAIFARHPDARIVFAGPRTDFSRNLFRSVDDRRIVECDAVSLPTKTALLAECALLCLPSTQESFGGVIVEAWSLGRPVVAADAPALRTVVTHGRDGLLSSVEPPAIADAINALLDDDVTRQSMGQAGQVKQREYYAWPVLSQKTREIYAGVRGGQTR